MKEDIVFPTQDIHRNQDYCHKEFALMNYHTFFLCDHKSKTVQMIDKDGQFLLHLIEPQIEDKPSSLGYDVHTKSLWVGTMYSNILSIYTYNDQDSLAGTLK